MAVVLELEITNRGWSAVYGGVLHYGLLLLGGSFNPQFRFCATWLPGIFEWLQEREIPVEIIDDRMPSLPHSVRVEFKEPDDAVMFKLRWL